MACRLSAPLPNQQLLLDVMKPFAWNHLRAARADRAPTKPSHVLRQPAGSRFLPTSLVHLGRLPPVQIKVLLSLVFNFYFFSLSNSYGLLRTQSFSEVRTGKGLVSGHFLHAGCWHFWPLDNWVSLPIPNV